MPIIGTADVAPWLEFAAEMPSLDTEPLELPNVRVLQVLYEIDDADMAGLIPAALHPTIPPTMHCIGMQAEGGPLGAFTLAMVRIGCRAAVRPRGLPTRVVVSGSAAAEALASRWGFPVTEGDARLRERYDRVEISAADGGETVLAAQMIDPIPIGNGDLQYTAGMHLAKAVREGETKPWLVQVDPEYQVSRADRGQARIDAFNAGFWRAVGAAPVYPIVASYTTANITLPKIRYICDPDQSALTGTVAV